MYLLDTNVMSKLRRPKPHGAVVAWLRSVEASQLHLSAVTLGEIQAGIEITREHDAELASEIEIWADQIAETWNVLPMDGAAFRLWAKLMHGKSPDLTRRHDRGNCDAARSSGGNQERQRFRRVRRGDP